MRNRKYEVHEFCILEGTSIDKEEEVKKLPTILYHYQSAADTANLILFFF